MKIPLMKHITLYANFIKLLIKIQVQLEKIILCKEQPQNIYLYSSRFHKVIRLPKIGKLVASTVCKGTCCQARQPEFNLPGPHDGKEELTPVRCPLTFKHSLCPYISTWQISK